jgi:hypothetical protein
MKQQEEEENEADRKELLTQTRSLPLLAEEFDFPLSSFVFLQPYSKHHLFLFPTGE